jgi:N-acetylmuramoyl-L-alanine amidase
VNPDLAIGQSIANDKRLVCFTLQREGMQNSAKPGTASDGNVHIGAFTVPGKLPPGLTVVLDAGHGGTDPGAQRGDVQEKELTMAIVDKLKNQLIHRGLRVRLTRDSDTFVSLEERV